MGNSISKMMARQKKDAVAGKAFNYERHLAIRKTQLKIRATKAERDLYNKLVKWGYHVQFQKGFLAGGVVYIADFYLPRPYRLVIEVDGPSHFTKEGIIKDAKRDSYFRSRGFRVLHITNEQALALKKEQFMLDRFPEGSRAPLEYGYYDTSHFLKSEATF